MSGPTRRTTVAVCGSCTSRDNFNSRFNADHSRWFEVTADVFQTSMISLMSEPLDFPAADTESYQERITREDVTRDFLPRLAAARPDFLVLDFFADVHFGVARLPDGRFLTDNRWMLRRTDFYAGLAGTTELSSFRLHRDPDAYVNLWVEAMDRFAGFVAEHCPTTRVIVHRGLNTDQVVAPGRDRPVPLRTLRPRARRSAGRLNELWARLDEHAISAYGWDSIDLRAEQYTSYAEHPWKPFYVHYTPDYYHRFLAELHLRVLADEVDAATLTRIATLPESGREHAALYGDLWGRMMQSREQRIRELEDLGPVGAARFALGRRLRQTRARVRRRLPTRRRPATATTDKATTNEETR